MGIENAKTKLSEAVYALKLAQVGAGRGPGARELALAATNAEQAEMWLQSAERAQAVGSTSDNPPSGIATTNQG